MNVLGTRFRLAIPLTLASIAFLIALATAPNTASAAQSHAPTELTAEFCGGAICFSWTPGTSHYDFQQVNIWKGGNASNDLRGTLAPETDSTAWLPLHYLNLEPSEVAGATVLYSFQVVAINRTDPSAPRGSKSNRITLELPRPLIVQTDANPPIILNLEEIMNPGEPVIPE